MLGRRLGEGRRQTQHSNKLLLAFAIILLPWLQIADAQQQQQYGNHQAVQAAIHADVPLVADDDSHLKAAGDESIANVASTAIRAVTENAHDSPLHQNTPQSDSSNRSNNRKPHQKRQVRPETKQRSNIIQKDESAIATFAPADDAVRAPRLPRHQGSSSYPAGGLSSPQIARSLADWEVEDFVLLATVDGDLYASDRKTGKELWHLEVDQPMVETIHHRANKSILDEDFNIVDHYVWAVEPSQNGDLYVWVPDSELGNAGLIRTGFTMKSLVEQYAPHFTQSDPGLIYTGDKKTTMVTLDASTGRVLKWFGSTGAHVNEAESCFQKNTFQGDDEECSTVGTVTLGRTEYTVSIQRRDTAQSIATLKYSEWSPNNYDNDLIQQYHESLDSKYMASRHDGKVYAFDQSRSEHSPLFSQKFSAPVARVFDVCKPWDAVSESNPQLVILPQPPMPSKKQDVADLRKHSIFLNQTEAGSWYAMSGSAYPLIIDAPTAQASGPGWDMFPTGETNSPANVHSALIGRHNLGAVRTGSRPPPSLPAGPTVKPDGLENEAKLPSNPVEIDPDESNIVRKVKSLPQGVSRSLVDFVSNPIVIILVIFTIIYNQKKLRKAYHRLRKRGVMKEAYELFVADEEENEKETIVEKQDAKQAIEPSASDEVEVVNDKAKEQLESDPKLVEPSTEDPKKSVEQSIELKEPRELTEFTGLKEPQTPKASIDRQLLEEEVATPKAEVDSPLDTDKSEPSPEAPTRETSVSDDAKSEDHRTPQEKALEELLEAEKKETAESPATPGQGKKKARRGRRGGVKHKKGQRRDNSQSRDDEHAPATLDETVNILMKPNNPPSIQPDVRTIGGNDMQSVNGPIIRMGNIEVNTDEQLGTGSNGTLVFAGRFDGRDVAVKRMLIQFYDIASQETRLLRESDDHPNVIRYYSQVTQDNFLYIALERCAASLADVVERPNTFTQLADAGRMDLPGVLYQITNGISHLHSLRIVHRDLKPQNILVNMDKKGKARLMVSDFGLCKKMEDGQSSFGATTGRAAGTSGWRAPELLLDDDARDISMIEASTHSASSSVAADSGALNSKRATRAIDIFSLGLVFFYVLTSGSHPFDCGGRYMREVNIRKGNYNLDALDALGDFSFEAQDLIASMIDADPRKRPSAREVMAHPFFWSPKKRLAFLCDVSDHFEKEPREPPSPALQELERHADEVTKGDFLRMLPREFLDSLGKQRKYTGSRLLDLMRALRNKRNHYEDMSESLRRTVGPLPEGYLCFWTVKFPMLLIVCWNVVYNVQWEETDRFKEYYEPAGL